MTMKTILLPLGGGSRESALETALLAARCFGSYIEGLYVQSMLPATAVAGGDGFGAAIAAPDLVEDFQRQEREHLEEVRADFARFMDRHGVAGEGRAEAAAPSAGWLERMISGADEVGSHGRLFDLIVVARPVEGEATAMMSTLEAALFESGRPLLIAPPEVPRSLGRCVAVAWNGSTETARVLALGLPFLERAERVVVIAIEQGMVPGPSGDELVRYLKRNDIPAEGRMVSAESRKVGEAILEEAKAVGADLLVKGAYTQSRLRQMIFGGATSHILAAAELPVLMAH